MRRLYVLTAIVTLSTTPDCIAAQQAKPAGVVALRHVDSAKGTPFPGGLSIPIDSAHGHPLLWIGTGALLGGATGGIAAAVSASRTDDAMFVGPAIGLAAAACAVVGGLLGGLVYLVSR
jgi:hypothetical protein